MQKAHGSKLKAHGSNARLARQLALLLIVALLPRLVAGCWWQARQEDDRFGFGDSQSYWTLAQVIARGEPYQYGSDDTRVFRAPGYPLLLSVTFWIVQHTFLPDNLAWTAALVNLALNGLLLWLISRLGVSCASPRVGLAAAWLVARGQEDLRRRVLRLGRAHARLGAPDCGQADC